MKIDFNMGIYHKNELVNKKIITSNQYKNESEKELLYVLVEDRFFINDDLAWNDKVKLTYQNLQYLLKRYPITIEDIETKSDRFIALHELTTIVDGVLMTALTIHFNLCIGTLIQNQKSKKTHSQLIESLLCGDVVGTFLATELGYGNNVFALETTATLNFDDKKIVIHSPTAESIKFMPNTSNIGIQKIAVVFARLINKGADLGVFPFVVPLYNKNCELEQGVEIIKLGYKPGYDLDNSMTRFQNCEIPLENILLDDETELNDKGEIISTIVSRRRRFLNSIDRIQTGKLVLSTSMARGMSVSLKLASDYLSHKKTFAPGMSDVTIDTYNNVRSYLASSFVKTLVCKILFDDTRAGLQTNNDLAILKVVNTQLAQQVLFETREKMGLHGLFAANKVMTFLTQLPGVVTAEGDNEIILIRLGKELLSERGFASDLFDLIFKRKSLSQFRKSFLNLKISIAFKLFCKTKFARKTLFQSWNEVVESVIKMALVYSYDKSFSSLEKYLKEEKDFDNDLKKAILHNYELEISKFLNSKGFSLSTRSLSQKKVSEKILENKLSLFEKMKVPYALIRSPLLGNFVENYFSKYK